MYECIGTFIMIFLYTYIVSVHMLIFLVSKWNRISLYQTLLKKTKSLRIKTMFGSSLPPIVCRIAHSGSRQILCCVFVEKGQMMLKKIAKIKNFNNFILRHLVDFKYGIWWYRFWKFYNPNVKLGLLWLFKANLSMVPSKFNFFFFV
jgi:hypothetical protein